MRAKCLLILATLTLFSNAPAENSDSPHYDPERALLISQSAIGNNLPNVSLTDTNGSPVQLDQYKGKPLLVSMVYTSCHHICPMITAHLKKSVTAARHSLGEDSFNVVTIGFDTHTNTPEKMAVFARQNNITLVKWDFLSTSESGIRDLSRDLGFTWYPSPRGFDHITQLSIIDRDGLVYKQVYGDQFELPWLVEPLKELVFNLPPGEQHVLSSLITKVKLFCTVYDPGSGAYRIDYSLLVQVLIGFMVLLSVGIFLVREARK